MSKPERFPMQDGPTIDWITADQIYSLYVKLYGGSQSLEKIAERGGFSWSEVNYMLNVQKLQKHA